MNDISDQLSEHFPALGITLLCDCPRIDGQIQHSDNYDHGWKVLLEFYDRRDAMVDSTIIERKKSWNLN